MPEISFSALTSSFNRPKSVLKQASVESNLPPAEEADRLLTSFFKNVKTTEYDAKLKQNLKKLNLDEFELYL